MDTWDEPLTRLGRTDVYLLDQFMKGRFRPSMRVLDVGCGSGRNLDLFLRGGFEVWVVDPSADAIARTRAHAEDLGATIPEDRVRTGAVEEADLPARAFDVVLSVAVLHFARDREHWRNQVHALWERLAPGGILFVRLSTSIGIEEHVAPLGGGRFRLPSGREWFLVGLEDLLRVGEELGAELLEPVKTVNVQNRRCMTTWCLRRPPSE